VIHFDNPSSILKIIATKMLEIYFRGEINILDLKQFFCFAGFAKKQYKIDFLQEIFVKKNSRFFLGKTSE